MQVADRPVGNVAPLLVDDTYRAEELRLADRADPVPGVGGIGEEGGGAGLRHPHAVADADAERAISLDQRVGERGSAAAPVADRPERQGRETRLVEQSLIDGRHGEEGAQPPRIEQAHHHRRIEPLEDNHLSSGEQGWQAVEIDAGGMEERQEIERRVAGADVDGRADIDVVRSFPSALHSRRRDRSRGARACGRPPRPRRRRTAASARNPRPVARVRRAACAS